MKKSWISILPLASALVYSGSSLALPMSTGDLWDVSQGTVVTGDSGVLNYRPTYRSYIENMFGGSNTAQPFGHYSTAFKDYMSPGGQGGPVPAGYTHWVEWQTPSDMTLRSFNLVAAHDGGSRDIRYRGLTEFTLYAGDGSTWTQVYNYLTDPDANLHYDGESNDTYVGSHYLELAVDVIPIAAQHFRAEFIQAPWVTSTAIGSRIYELDGYDTFLDGSTGGQVPEPTTLALMGLGLAGIGWKRRKAA